MKKLLLIQNPELFQDSGNPGSRMGRPAEHPLPHPMGWPLPHPCPVLRRSLLAADHRGFWSGRTCKIRDYLLHCDQAPWRWPAANGASLFQGNWKLYRECRSDSRCRLWERNLRRRVPLGAASVVNTGKMRKPPWQIRSVCYNTKAVWHSKPNMGV